MTGRRETGVNNRLRRHRGHGKGFFSGKAREGVAAGRAGENKILKEERKTCCPNLLFHTLFNYI